MQNSQGISWCSFLKKYSWNFSAPNIFRGLFWLVLFQKVFLKYPKVFQIVLQYFGRLFCESELERPF